MRREATISIDGEVIVAAAGVPLASVLHRRSPILRRSPVLQRPRGLYCGMGVCFECQVLVDGRSVRSCVTPVADGMVVESIAGNSAAGDGALGDA